MAKLAEIAARRGALYILVLAASAFFFNEIWEVAQMIAYERAPGRSQAVEFFRCTRAALVDVVILFGIYTMGSLAAADFRWCLLHRWHVYLASSLMGLAVATFIERWALASERWSYSSFMPVIPFLHTGLWPSLQMVLLPPACLWWARYWVPVSPERISG